MNTLSAVIILEDGLLLAGGLLDQWLNTLGVRTRAVVRHIPPRRDDPLPRNIKAHLTPGETIRLGRLVISRRLQRMVPGGFVPTAHRRLGSLARRAGVPYVVIRDIHSASAQQTLRAFDADLFVTSLDTILKPEVLAIPHVACLNKHASLLPARAGRTPVFHAMAHGDAHTGLTVHEMTPEIDAGRILAQEAIPIRTTDTMWWLSRRVYGCAGRMLGHALTVLEDGAAPLLVEPPRSRSYHSVPTDESWRAFRDRGFRFA